MSIAVTEPPVATVPTRSPAPDFSQPVARPKTSGWQLFKDVLKEPDVEVELRPILGRYAKERNAGERFGDWCDRVLLKEQTVNTN